MPPFIFESAFSIRMTLVSAFAPEVTQQIHSLRASGVMSSQSAKTFGAEIIALRKSGGIVCTTPFPVESALVVIQIFYNFSHIFQNNAGYSLIHHGEYSHFYLLTEAVHSLGHFSKALNGSCDLGPIPNLTLRS